MATASGQSGQSLRRFCWHRAPCYAAMQLLPSLATSNPVSQECTWQLPTLQDTLTTPAIVLQSYLVKKKKRKKKRKRNKFQLLNISKKASDLTWNRGWNSRRKTSRLPADQRTPTWMATLTRAEPGASDNRPRRGISRFQ